MDNSPATAPTSFESTTEILSSDLQSEIQSNELIKKDIRSTDEQSSTILSDKNIPIDDYNFIKNSNSNTNPFIENNYNKKYSNYIEEISSSSSLNNQQQLLLLNKNDEQQMDQNLEILKNNYIDNLTHHNNSSLTSSCSNNRSSNMPETILKNLSNNSSSSSTTTTTTINNSRKLDNLCCSIDDSTIENNIKINNQQEEVEKLQQNQQQHHQSNENENENMKNYFMINCDKKIDTNCMKCKCNNSNKRNNCIRDIIINNEGINLPNPSLPIQINNPFYHHQHHHHHEQQEQNPLIYNNIINPNNTLNINNPILTNNTTILNPSLQSLYHPNYTTDDIKMKLPLIIVRPINNNKNCLSQSSSTTTITSSSTASFESVESATTTSSSVVSSPSTIQKPFILLDPLLSLSSSPPPPPLQLPLLPPKNNSNLNFKRKKIIPFKTQSLDLPSGSNIHREDDIGDDADDDDDDDVRLQKLPNSRSNSSSSSGINSNTNIQQQQQQQNCLRREVLQRNSEEALIIEFNQTEISSSGGLSTNSSLSPLSHLISCDDTIETKITRTKISSTNSNDDDEDNNDGAVGITIPTKTTAAAAAALNPFFRGMMPPKTQSVDSRPIYPNVPYSPYGSPYNSPRSNRRKTPLRESRRISIDKSGSFLQLNQYKLLDQIGQGSYGLVKLAYNEEDSTHYAMKILSKRRLLRKAGLMGRGPKKTTSSPLDRVYREIAVLKKLDHPNVVKLIEVLDDPLEDSLYLVFELVEKGEILSIPTDKPLSEERAWSVFRDAIQGLEYLHYQRIIHADIKPGNLLLGECGCVKIADLGVCNEFIGEDATLNNGSTAGTPAFRSPETLIPGQHLYSGKASDIWALGATLYSLVYGNVPFVANNVPGLYEKIKNQLLEFLDEPKISDNLKDLLEKILTKDPSKRITLPKLKEHSWVTRNGKYPLPSEEENCRLVQISDEDINTVVKSIPKLDTLILIKTMLKNHSFQHPFARGGITRRAPRITRAGRSISAPGAYHLPPDRQLSSENILPALTENVVTSSGNESSTEKSP